MKKSRILSLILCTALILSCFSLTAVALEFDDVENDSTVSWAKDSITKMTEAGYIKGYEDGTFRPHKSISKIECLILMSRMLGFEDMESFEEFEDVREAFTLTAAKYNQTYKNELGYLLYLDIIDGGDLADFASAANANTPLLRYQAAILMSKLMNKNDEAKAYSVSAPTYADNATIPTNARPYVEFVTEFGIMNGMDSNANGDPQFSPITPLTRAQMATLLARMMDKLDLVIASGEIEDADNSSVTIDGDTYAFSKTTVVRLDGFEADAADLAEGYTATALIISGEILMVEALSPQDITTVYGVVVRKSENSDGKKITIADYEDESISETYTLKDDCKITVNDTKGSFADIMADDFVRLDLVGAKVSALSTEDIRVELSGKLLDIDYDAEEHVYLTIGDKNGDNPQVYTVSIKGVKISRDGETAEFRDLSVGDSVDIRLSYGKVTIVTATSTTEKFSGLLTEIIISNSPAVTITTNGVSKRYNLRSDVKIKVAGEEADIYDLRPNISVSGTLDSDEVKTLTASSVVVNEKGEMTGTVTGKNTNYSVITIEDEDGNTQSVYYNSSTTFLNSSGRTISVKTIEKGATVSITGSETNGVFEATIVIVK